MGVRELKEERQRPYESKATQELSIGRPKSNDNVAQLVGANIKSQISGDSYNILGSSKIF